MPKIKLGKELYEKVEKAIKEYPELGFKTVDEFTVHSIIEELKSMGYEIPKSVLEACKVNP